MAFNLHIKAAVAGSLGQWTPVDSSAASIDEKTMTMEVVMTTTAKDRQGDRVSARGLNFDNYMKNPVVLWNHDQKQKPIGKVLAIRRENDKVMAKVQFNETDMGKDVFKLYRDGFLKGWSIGFISKNASSNGEGDDIFESEMVELSAVNVPANPEALTRACAGITCKALADELMSASRDTVAAPSESDKVPNKIADKKQDCPECGASVVPDKDCKCPECGAAMLVEKGDEGQKSYRIDSKGAQGFKLASGALTKTVREKGIPIPDGMEMEIEPVEMDADGITVKQARIVGFKMKYSPDQARDEDGKWSDSGGGSSASGSGKDSRKPYKNPGSKSKIRGRLRELLYANNPELQALDKLDKEQEKDRRISEDNRKPRKSFDELTIKEGRAISTANLERLAALLERIGLAWDELEALLSENAPTQDSAISKNPPVRDVASVMEMAGLDMERMRLKVALAEAEGM